MLNTALTPSPSTAESAADAVASFQRSGPPGRASSQRPPPIPMTTKIAHALKTSAVS
jgi:hypothetical protein